ncbi:MAG: lysophospholipid acyltransferase family protein [Nitrospinaceae bacterium]
MKKFLLDFILPYLAFGIFYLWCFTIRVRNKNPGGEKFFFDLPGRYILTLWHGRIFYLFYHLRRHRDFHLLISPSEDGNFLARLAHLMGYSVIRGSSYKKAVPATRSLIRILKRDERIILIADGSRGPRCKAQAGSIHLSKITGAPVIPMTFGASRQYVFKSWDRFVLPLPFTQCTLNFGHPIHVPRKADKKSLLEKQRELEESLNRITEACD